MARIIKELYRIENENGVGPFHASTIKKGLCPIKHKEYMAMPCPDEDRMVRDYWDNDDLFFAFPDYVKCKQFWSQAAINHLHKLGFKLTCYRTTGKVIKGKSGLQAAFVKYKAKKVWEAELTTLLED